MDGSVMPTQGSANPGLTIQALAARTADYILSQKDSIMNGERGDLATPPVRKSLCPPGTFRSGILHF